MTHADRSQPIDPTVPLPPVDEPHGGHTPEPNIGQEEGNAPEFYPVTILEPENTTRIPDA